jgi:pimeloyl-ACP methyl ester carboxylesterase
VLVHGFASSLYGNWVQPGIVKSLVDSGRRVIALDCRGHGRSGKPHDPAAYGDNAMANDVLALMDHLGLKQADLMGYSMGGGISAGLLASHQDRFTSVILAGIGDGLVTGEMAGRRSRIADGMEATDASALEDPVAKRFREFAERSGNDLGALGAMQRSIRTAVAIEGLEQVHIPVMVLVGKDDDLAGGATKLAAKSPGAQHVVVPGDHLTVFQFPDYLAAVHTFLKDASPFKA